MLSMVEVDKILNAKYNAMNNILELAQLTGWSIKDICASLEEESYKFAQRTGMVLKEFEEMGKYKKPKKNISQMNDEAREHGMTYGKYVGLVETLKDREHKNWARKPESCEKND